MKISSTKKSHRIISVLLAFTMVIGGVICDRSSSDVYAAPSGNATLTGDGSNLTISSTSLTSCVVDIEGPYLQYNSGGSFHELDLTSYSSVTIGQGVLVQQRDNTNIDVNISLGYLEVAGTLTGDITTSGNCCINDGATHNGTVVVNDHGVYILDGTCYETSTSIIYPGGTFDINGTYSGNIINPGGTVSIDGTVNGNISNQASGTVILSDSATITLPNDGAFVNEDTATLKAGTFNSGTYGDKFMNLGKIVADNITLHSSMLYDPSSAEYDAKKSITLGIDNSAGMSGIGTVIANSDTDIIMGASTYDVTFNLKVGANEKPITLNPGDVKKTAGYYMKEIPSVVISDEFPDYFLFGTKYNILKYVGSDSNGAMSVRYIEHFAEAGFADDILPVPQTEAPTDTGTHRALISIAETDSYRDLSDYSFDFSIEYLTPLMDENMGASLEADLIRDGSYYYTNKPYKIVANSGFQVSNHSYSGDEPNSEFADTYTVKKDGYYNGTLVSLRRKSDNATSDYYFIDSSAIYLDQKAPEVDASSVVDQDGNTPAQRSMLQNLSLI